MLYVTTDKFLRVFGLNALDELPETEALSVAAAQAEGTDANQEVTEAEQLALEMESEAVPSDYTEPVDGEEEDVAIEAIATAASPPPDSDKEEDLS
jgi:hypothetical protein